MFKTTLHAAREFAAKNIANMIFSGEAAEPIMFHSFPGVGKSAVVNTLGDYEIEVNGKKDTISKMMEERFNANFKIWDWRVGAMQESDIMGIPYPTSVGMDDEGREIKDMMFSTPMNFPREGECGILFLDELSNAPIPNQHSCYRLIHDRTIHNGRRLPEGVIVMAAGNTKEDKTGAKGIVPALARRFSTHFKIEPSVDDFTEHAFRKQFHHAVIAYLNYAPQNLCVPAINGEYGFATPANWESASKILKNPFLSDEEKENGVSACLGSTVCHDFIGFVRYQDIMPDFKRIKETGEYKLPKGDRVDLGAKFTIITATGMQIINAIDNEEGFDAVDNLAAVLDTVDTSTVGVVLRQVRRARKDALAKIASSSKMPRLKAHLADVMKRTSEMK